jgi:type IV pilus assembly protein PilQ
VVSNPKVLTADNKKATILQGRQIPYSTVSQDGTKVEFKDAFLKLEVTPQITPDDRVGLKLKVSKDEEGAVVQTATGPQASIDKREVETDVMVNNGETVVLGGVFEQTKGDRVSKVPSAGRRSLVGLSVPKHQQDGHQARAADFRDAANPEERHGRRALTGSA